LVLREIGHESAKNVKACVGAYRYGGTQIQLPKRIEKMLAELSRERNLYLVTDGNKIVQRLKVESLGLDRFFVGIFITHRFGKDKAKPSLYCFDKVAAREGASLSDIIYVADDPHKDFVKLNKAGATTIRVCTGRFRTTKAAAGYDARITIDSLDELRQTLLRLERNESA
jgi:putative hydrolase of the HAD superfamily